MKRRRNVKFVDAASQEFTAAVRWYEATRPGLGADLYDAVGATIASIERRPEIGTADYADRSSRRVIVARFPYHVVYRLHGEDIVILAVAHMKRRPGFWKHQA